MNEDPEVVYKKLLAIERKHSGYFADKGFHIFSCVHIVWMNPTIVQVIYRELPTDIRQDIDAEFGKP